MTRCLDNDTLERFVAGKLSAEENAAAEAHLESCRRCAEALDKLPVGDETIDAIRDLTRSRNEINSSLARLNETEQRVTSTMFKDLERQVE